MPNEKVLNLPLSSDEIIEIILQRLDSKMRADCFLHLANTYNGFTLHFEMKLKFSDMMIGRETLIWDQHVELKRETDVEALAHDEEVLVVGEFNSGDSPNSVRLAHDLPLPIETQEGKRKVIRHRKVKDSVE